MNGKFSDPQRDLYNAVLNVHRTCLSLCRESSNISLDRLHNVAEDGLKDQLQQLGFDVSGNVRILGLLFLLGNANLSSTTGYERPVPPSPRALYWTGCPRLSWVPQKLCSQGRPVHYRGTVCVLFLSTFFISPAHC